MQEFSHSNLWLWWEKAMQSLSMEQGQDRVNLTINIFWHIWKARNKRIFYSAKQEPHKTVQKAQEEWLEFEQARESDQESSTTQNMSGQQAKNEQLREDVVCLYTDATISAKRIRTGQGIIARNWKGKNCSPEERNSEH